MQKHLNLINDDCLSSLKSLADNSIDLIVTDPPYYQVKPGAWDNQWANQDDFLSWLDCVALELWRVLKPTGTLYLFCGSRLASQTEILLQQRFEVLNHIIWTKPSGPWNRACKENLRSFFPATERIIMCGHYGAEGSAKGASQYHDKCQDLKRHVFAPLIDYFQKAKERLNIPAKAINEATGTQMCSHWFSPSQWKLPTAKQYAQLQALFAKYEHNALTASHEGLVQQFAVLHENYQVLVREYDDLKAQYHSLRRPFAVTKEVQFTDVWSFKSVPYYPGKHPCEKPAELLEHIINASSRQGETVLDCFMGGGSTGRACLALDRRFIGIEMDAEIFARTAGRFEQEAKTLNQAALCEA